MGRVPTAQPARTDIRHRHAPDGLPAVPSHVDLSVIERTRRSGTPVTAAPGAAP